MSKTMKAMWLVAVYPLMAQPPQQPGQEAGGRGPSAAIQQRVQPPARIMSFTAEPANIKPGESAVLSWATENPSGVNIDQGVGRVTPRGIMRVMPAATTVYTLTIGGPNGPQNQSVTVNVAGTTPLSAATLADIKKEVPKLINGKPDFSGVYDFSGNRGGGRVAGGGRAGRGRANVAAAESPGGLPTTPKLKPGAERYRVVRGPEDTGADANCMPLAGPNAFGVPYQFQLVLNTNSLVILHEYPGTFRTIPISGLPHPKDPDPTWMGDSVGHWEGDTLVVDTVGFNEKTEIMGFKHTEALHIVERFSKSDFDILQYQAVIEDPNVFEGPFVVNRSFALRPDLAKVDEFVCENNRDYKVLFKKP